MFRHSSDNGIGQRPDAEERRFASEHGQLAGQHARLGHEKGDLHKSKNDVTGNIGAAT